MNSMNSMNSTNSIALMRSIDPNSVIDSQEFVDRGRDVVLAEATAIHTLAQRIGEDFAEACRHLLACRGRVIVCGVGKSGHIGTKLAATFASTGTPAFFVHAAEASHGDLGMLREQDVVLALSYSGSSDEVVAILPGIRRLGATLIAMTGNKTSVLAASADVHLDVAVDREACPLGLAPTASTSAMLAMGDALAIALLHARGFNEEDFARSHPGGRLGKRLLLRVSDVMSTGKDLPIVQEHASVSEALLEISKKGLGMVAVISQNNRLCGIFTDGDLRRTIASDQDLRPLGIRDVMTANPRTIESNQLAFDAVNQMQEARITTLPVTSEGDLQGVVSMHGLLAAGVV